jgi:predicted S18 family serine protease
MSNNFVLLSSLLTIMVGGWVNPEVSATPLTGYRKRAASASDSGAIPFIISSQSMGAFVF